MKVSLLKFQIYSKFWKCKQGLRNYKAYVKKDQTELSKIENAMVETNNYNVEPTANGKPPLA